jgi:hypothetical protein
MSGSHLLTDQPLDPNSVFSIASQFIVSCPPSNPPLPFAAFPGLSINAQQCFQESNTGSFSTNTVNYATVVQQVETATTGALYANATAVAAAVTTTDAAAASSTTGSASTTTTTTSTDTAAAAATAAPTKRAESLEARAFAGGCAAPGVGSVMQLVPDFSKARNVDFKKINKIFVTILSGIEVFSIEAQFQGDGSVVVGVPGNIGGGQVFVFITTIDLSGKSFSDSNVLFGPAIMESK